MILEPWTGQKPDGSGHTCSYNDSVKSLLREVKHQTSGDYGLVQGVGGGNYRFRNRKEVTLRTIKSNRS